MLRARVEYISEGKMEMVVIVLDEETAVVAVARCLVLIVGNKSGRQGTGSKL